MSEIKISFNLVLLIGLIACAFGFFLYIYSVRLGPFLGFGGWYYTTVYPYRGEGFAIGVFGAFLTIVGILLKRSLTKSS